MPCPNFEAALGQCVHCRGAKLQFDAALTLGPYDGTLRQIVLKLKHAEFEPLAHQVGSLLSDRVRPVAAQQPIDLVTCVPMHWLKRWVRGSSAPEVLARRVASDLRLPCYPDLLRCLRLLKKQSSLTMPQRWLNVRGSYRVARGFDIRATSVLVIDDVLTSGATVNEVAKALRRAGASRVTVAAIARGTGELT
jgi:predicted amidophosphoribosyltransferase